MGDTGLLVLQIMKNRNKTDEDCSELGTIGIRSFAGGIGRLY